MELNPNHSQKELSDSNNNDWRCLTVGDLINFEGGSQPYKGYFKDAWRPGYVRLIQIRDYKTDKYETYVPVNMARRFCDDQDIMIGRYGPPIFQILRGLAGAYNVALIKAIPSPELDKSYAYYFLSQNCLFNLIEKLSQRSAGQAGVDLVALRAFPLMLPATRAEQVIIASALQDADGLIDSLEQLLAKKHHIKAGSMLDLLTGKRRLSGFCGAWELRQICDISYLSTVVNSAGDDLPVLTCSKHFGFVDSLSYFKSQVFSNDTRKYKIILRDQIGYPANHIEEGAIGLQDCYDKAIVSPIYVVFSVAEPVNSYFLQRLLKLERYRWKFLTATNSSVSRRGSLRWSEFSKIEVAIPPIEEQAAIAIILSQMEQEITAIEAKLTKARHLKQAMMQKLLTGQIRLVQPSTEEAKS